MTTTMTVLGRQQKESSTPTYALQHADHDQIAVFGPARGLQTLKPTVTVTHLQKGTLTVVLPLSVLPCSRSELVQSPA